MRSGRGTGTWRPGSAGGLPAGVGPQPTQPAGDGGMLDQEMPGAVADRGKSRRAALRASAGPALVTPAQPPPQSPASPAPPPTHHGCWQLRLEARCRQVGAQQCRQGRGQRRRLAERAQLGQAAAKLRGEALQQLIGLVLLPPHDEQRADSRDASCRLPPLRRPAPRAAVLGRRRGFQARKVVHSTVQPQLPVAHKWHTMGGRKGSKHVASGVGCTARVIRI
jgi:hypothetical protein